MRALAAPKLYVRHGKWWCYWQNDRWSTRTADRRTAEERVRQRYDPRVLSSQEASISDAVKLLYDALDNRGRSAATRKIARQKLGHFVRLWAALPLSAIDYATVAAYIKTRLEDDAVSRLTVSGELGYLRQAWKLARAQGLAYRAWDELMPERFDRKYTPRTRWLTAHELAAVLRSLPAKKRAIVAWIVGTGADVGDLVRAQRADLDWKRGMARVRGTKTVFRDRWVPITPVNRPLLKLAAEHGPPFVRWPWINGELRRLARLLGIPHFTPKDLRRTHGHWLRHAGIHPHLIGRVLGHADSAMADKVYAQGEDMAIARLLRSTLRTNVRTNVRSPPTRVRFAAARK